MRFFIANPTGRILNRFAKDQNLADETLPATFYMFIESFVYCLSAIILVCISIPWLIILMPFLIILFAHLREKYSTREIKRIEATTRSPIYSDFSATLDGLMTLRAYHLETV
jgi:ATP-binding cassette subfamily C (CFTR/MRP) protein 4